MKKKQIKLLKRLFNNIKRKKIEELNQEIKDIKLSTQRTIDIIEQPRFFTNSEFIQIPSDTNNKDNIVSNILSEINHYGEEDVNLIEEPFSYQVSTPNVPNLYIEHENYKEYIHNIGNLLENLNNKKEINDTLYKSALEDVLNEIKSYGR